MSKDEWIKKAYSSFCSRLFGVKGKKVLFMSFSGKSYSDNPRAISEALHRLDQDVEIIWAFLSPEEKRGVVPPYIKLVDRAKAANFYKALATSKVFVTNFSIIAPKDKRQRFIQTWHGDRAFKKILYDANPIRERELSESVNGFCDLMVAGSDYGERQLRSAFHYQGEILKVGTPRDDALLRMEIGDIAKIRSGLGISEKTRILLYAPTLRDQLLHRKENQEIQDLDLASTLKKLEVKYHTDWICLVRAHPWMGGLSGFDSGNKIIDVSSYEDMADLLLISDMLITDYSSCAGDYALTHRPIILYQSDRKEYLEKDRTFYFNMEDSPYMIAESQQELEAWIERIDEKTAWDNCEAILKFYNTYESGQAAEAVAKRILDWLN